MTERERKLKRKIQFIVASCMALFFCLVLVLAVQLAVRGNQRSMEKSLLATQNELLLQMDDLSAWDQYLLSQKFIEEYALKVLGYGRDKSKISN